VWISVTRAVVGEWVGNAARLVLLLLTEDGSDYLWNSACGCRFCGVVLFFVSCGKEQDNGTGVWSSLNGIIN